MNKQCLLIIFARAPVAGQCNRRLAKTIGDAAAAELQAELLQHRLQQFAQQPDYDTELHCSPDCSHAVFTEANASLGITLREQRGADLGERMANAMHAALEDYRHVALVGTDAPCVDAASVASGFRLLQDKPVVLQPAEDGGYVLVAMRAPGYAIFDDIPWGSDEVMTRTRQRVQQLGIEQAELPLAWDIDEIEDLDRYREWQQSGAS